MNKARWLVMAFLVCLLLLTPTDLEGLQLVGAIRNHLFLPASSPLHHLPDLLEEQPVNQLWLDRRRNNVEEVRRRKSERSEVKMGGQRPLVAVMKKEKHGAAKKNSKESSGSSSMVIVGLAVASAALVALIGICCCACRDSASSSSPYDLRDDKPLLSLNLGDMSSGSSRKSSATPIDVSRLGALTSECQQQMDRGKPGTMSMKVSMQSQAMRMSSHEITTIAGAGRGNKLSASSAAAAADHAPPPPPPPPAPTAPAPPAPPPPSSSHHRPPPAAPHPPVPVPAPAPAPSPAPPPPAAAAGPPPPPPPAAPAAPRAPGPPPPPATGRVGAGPPPPALPGGPRARGPPPFKKSAGTAAPAASVDASKAKLKPFFWDKVTANPNQTMVWDQIKAGSFQFNEEMIESLFGCQSTEKKSSDGKKELAAKEATQFVRILDPKKAQNLAISLKALSVSAEQVRAAVLEGHDLPPDLIQTLVRWSPTSDEELRLRLYTGERSQLGPAEQFMRAIIDVPYLYQRLDTLLFMASLPEEAAAVEQSFATLEVACQELRGSRLFKKLLEAVLKTGNRMNDGTFRGGAQAFKLDTLLKLADVKGVDGKITLLHFVVQEIIRSEGVRAARAASGGGSSSVGSISSAEDLIVLQTQSSIGSDSSSSDQQEYDETERYKQLGLGVVSSLGDDLQNVRKAACLDADALTISVASLGHRLVKANDFLSTGMRSLEEDSGFHRRLASFVEQSQAQVTHLLEEEKKLRLLVRSTVDYFHGSTGKDEGLRLFVVVRDFLAILDKVCREVKEQAAAKASKKPTPAPRSRQSSQSSLSSSFRDPRQQLQDRRAAAQSRHSSSSSSSDSD
ncbi:formin-like protein 18 [Oryza brachyantha]|uniref:formin-like protein 18 n=1 Tax=Oryza brachyantha TaxID=4533 RepID=UPI001ADBEF5F|nr:formin-like protein 18 [Oryza brachyantha]